MESFDKAGLLAKIAHAVSIEVSDHTVAKSLLASIGREVDRHHNSPVHEGICNCCQHQIVGVRYKCPVCLEFNLCEVCEPRIDHEHAMLKIKYQG
jgi:hypothetical protein